MNTASTEFDVMETKSTDLFTLPCRIRLSNSL
jgi:hypothetical protein